MVVVLSLATLAGACGSSGDDGGTGATTTTAGAGGGSGASGTTITISNFTFSPTPMNGQRAAAVTIENKDTTTHTVTADDNSFDTGNIAAGTSAQIMLPIKAGDYGYHCHIHNSMKGVIHVTG
jgi:plastocyanin